jgi:hypothetical protein
MAYMTNTVWVEDKAPRWAADFRSRDHLVPGGVKLLASAFPVEDAVTVTAPSGAAAAATSISVNALSGPIPNGTVLNFTGSGEFAMLTAAAATGATTLSVEALDAAIEAADTATYAGTLKRFVRSGTPIGRTIAERDAGTAFGPADAADDEIYLLAFDVPNLDEDNDGVLYRHASVVKENLLPNYSSIAAGVMTKLRDKYVMQRGVA